jgi:hypothetical protein
MKRYNHDGVPMPMVEDNEGYWVTYEDYNQSLLDCNKLVEKSWRASSVNKENTQFIHEEEIQKLWNIIITLSIVTFSLVSILFFTALK